MIIPNHPSILVLKSSKQVTSPRISYIDHIPAKHLLENVQGWSLLTSHQIFEIKHKERKSIVAWRRRWKVVILSHPWPRCGTALSQQAALHAGMGVGFNVKWVHVFKLWFCPLLSVRPFQAPPGIHNLSFFLICRMSCLRIRDNA